MNVPRVLSGRRWKLMLGLIGNGLGQGGAAIGTALIVEYVFSNILGDPSFVQPQQVIFLCGGLTATVAVAAWLRGREQVDAERLGQDYVHQLRVMLFDKLTSTSGRSLQQRSHGATALRFVGDLSALRRWVSFGLARLVVALTMILLCVIALALLEPILAGVAGIVLAVGVVASASLGSRLREASRDARRRRSQLAGNVNEKIGTVSVLQAFGQVERERRRVRKQSKRLQDAMVERAKVAGMLRALTEGAAGLAAASVIVVGVIGQAKPGAVAAAMTIIGLLVPSMRDLGRVQDYWQNGRVSREKVEEFLARPSGLCAREGAPAPAPGPGRLLFDNIQLNGALNGLSATAEPGETVAIVGPNGAGKSTLLLLAARLMDPDGGRILVDGCNLLEYDAAGVRRLMGLVSPDLPLLRGSIRRNLLYRFPEAPPEEIARVVRLCGLREMIDELPDGMDTRVGEGGRTLSAGERQRLALARAILGSPPILILDEADANMDQTAANVVDHIVAEHPGTVLIATHRRERVLSADVVWHMRQGRLVEIGPPDALLSSSPDLTRLIGPHLRALG